MNFFKNSISEGPFLERLDYVQYTIDSFFFQAQKARYVFLFLPFCVIMSKKDNAYAKRSIYLWQKGVCNG